MSKNTEYKLDIRMEIAFTYLRDLCSKNCINFHRKFIKKGDSIYIICWNDYGVTGSMGINSDEELKFYLENKALVEWAEEEGFEEEDVYSKFEKDIVKEVTLIQLAKALIKNG